MAGVTLDCFFRKKQEETEKKEATLKKITRTEREKRSCINEKKGTARKREATLKENQKQDPKKKSLKRKKQE